MYAPRLRPHGSARGGGRTGRTSLKPKPHLLDARGSTHVVDIQSLLGDEAESLLNHESKGIPREDLHLPGPDYIDRVFSQTERSAQVMRNMQALYDHGRLAGTGYVSILPVDQGIEHSAAASFAP